LSYVFIKEKPLICN